MRSRAFFSVIVRVLVSARSTPRCCVRNYDATNTLITFVINFIDEKYILAILTRV